MRKSRLFALVLAAVAALCMLQPLSVSPAAAAAAETITNGGFENGLTGWLLPSWFTGVTTIDSTTVHSGAGSLRFNGYSKGPYLYQEVPAAAGQKITVSGWVNIPVRKGNETLIADLVPRHDANGDLTITTIGTFNAATSGWVQFTGSATMPARTIAVRLRLRLPELNGTVYVDDLSMTADTAPVTSTPAPTQPPATATVAPTRPPATATVAPTQPTATVAPTQPTATVAPTQTTATPTVAPTQPTATATAGPTLPPYTGNGVLANTAWPTYGQNVLRNNRSPYAGPQTQPTVKWSFSKNEHWGTDYRGIDLGVNNTLYLASGMAGVYSIDTTNGLKKWLFSPDNTGHETWVEFPPTIASDGTLYVASENDWLYALDPSGTVKWKFQSNHLHTPPSISPDGTTIHFVSENGYLYAVDRLTGKQKWTYQLGPGAVYGTGRRIPVVYDTAGNLYFSWVSTAWSVTPNGAKRWNLYVGNHGSYMVGPAVGSDGTLYFVYSNYIFAIGMDGKQKWQYILDKSAFDRTPAIGGDGTIYIGAEDGCVYAFNPNGSLKWKQNYVSITGWGGGVKSNILVDSKGTLYFLGKDQFVYAVSSSTKQVLWKYSTGYDDKSYPGIQLSMDANGVLYSPVNEQVMVALAPAAGTAQAPTPTPDPTQPAATATPAPNQAATATPAPTQQPTVVPTATVVPTVGATSTPPPSGSILYGSWVGSAVNVAGDEAAFEKTVGKARAIRHWYASVAPLSNNSANFAAWSKTMDANEILMLSFTPAPQDSTLDNVNKGTHDAYITGWAQALKAYGGEVMLRPMWEDNGSWYWWKSGADWDTNSKNKYKTAYQRVVNIFRQAGATNVKFIWCPNVSGNGSGTASLSYPGASYVDWIGLDGYPMRGGKGDFYSTFKPDYDALTTLGKPMMVCETSSSIILDKDRAAYITDLFTKQLPVNFPNFKAFVYFSEPNWGNILDPAYPLTAAAFKNGISSSYYKGR